MHAALITGGARRIGKHIALTLADLGYDIALHYNTSESQASSLADELKEMDCRCELFQADLSKPSHVEHLIDGVRQSFPELSILVNNASIFEPASIADTTNDSLFKHLNTNLIAPFILTRDFANGAEDGQVINILDTHISQARTTHAAYLLAKKGLADFTEMAAKEYAPDVRVNAIAPGAILPPPHADLDHMDRILDRIPMKRQGDVDHITSALSFFLENDYLTGQIIYADGGEHL